jgi:MSHA biogenesis protein MshG
MMPRFKYKGRNADGQTVTEVLEADSATAVAKRLSGMGVTPIQILLESAAKGMAGSEADDDGGSSFFNRVSNTDVVMFTRQLVTLYKAGLPFLASLDAIANQTGSPAMTRVIKAVKVDVESGCALSAALAKHPKVFPEVYTATVLAGETGGVLDQVMDRLVTLMENEAETRQMVKSAIRYPITVIGAMTIAFGVIVTFVIPTFSKMFAKGGHDLPLPTQIMVGINTVRESYWHVCLLVLAGLITAFIVWVRTPAGRLVLDRLTLKFPLVGSIIMKASMARLAHMFGTLSESGLPILKMLGVISRTIGNRQISLEIEATRAAVQEGSNLGTALGKSTNFPPLVKHMVAVGEKTGAMSDMMNSVGEHYDRETRVAISRLTQSIEPLITLVLGAGLLFMALAVFLPMWDMIKVMGSG